jgi:hypothetical protein
MVQQLVEIGTHSKGLSVCWVSFCGYVILQGEFCERLKFLREKLVYCRFCMVYEPSLSTIRR